MAFSHKTFKVLGSHHFVDSYEAHAFILYFMVFFNSKTLLQNSDVCRVSKVSLFCSCDKVLKVAFVRSRWLYCLKGNVSGNT